MPVHFSIENINSHIMLFFPWFLHPLLWEYNAKKIKHSCLPYNEKHKAFNLACLFITHSTIHSFLTGLKISWFACMNNSVEQHTSVIASLSYPCMYLWFLSCNDYRNYHFHHFCFFLSFFCLISCTDLFL